MTKSIYDLRYEFGSMRIMHGLLLQAHDVLDGLRHHRRRVVSGPYPFMESPGRCLVAPTDAGKSTIIDSYLESRIVKYCIDIGLYPPETPHSIILKEQKIVLRVSVSGTGTRLGLLEDMLTAFECPYATSRESAGQKLKRIYVYLKQKGTELIIFDEINNLKMGGPLKDANEATKTQNTMRDFMKAGYPVLFAGSGDPEKGLPILKAKEILSRTSDLSIGPLDYKYKDDWSILKDYCKTLGVMLSVHEIFPFRANLGEDELVLCFYEASKGYLGRISKIVEAAVPYAMEEGADTVSVSHLAMGVDQYSIRKGFVTHNPFRVGLQVADRDVKGTMLH